jgi:hypothetical protein
MTGLVTDVSTIVVVTMVTNVPMFGMVTRILQKCSDLRTSADLSSSDDPV